MDIINVDLMTLITLLLSVAAGLVTWVGLGMVDIAQEIRAALLLIGNAVAVWLLFGALVVRRIAIPAVVIGGLTAFTAAKLGWRTYSRIGGHLVMAVIETYLIRLILIASLVTASMAAGAYIRPEEPAIVAAFAAGAVLLAIVSFYLLMLQVEVKIWLKQYRHWVSLYFPNLKLRLLSGRVHSISRR